MKKISFTIIFSLLTIGLQNFVQAQCASQVVNGTATNMFTLIRNGNHPIAVDKNLNMVVFIHRTDVGLFGGNSGELRFDVSTNAGATWTLNQGVLNPANANYARYPNLAIYNPTSNINPSNAYVSYLAPTITSATSVWNGVVSGVRQVGGGIPTETYNQNGIGVDQIPHSMIRSAPGIFWAIDPINIIATGYKLYKGVWSTTANDVVWNQVFSVNPPFTSGWTGAPQVVDYNIAFDPTGQIGYFSFLGHVSGNAPNNAIYPVLYKTTNGGTTWTGPIQVDLSGLSCIASNTTTGSFASCNVEHDLIVDVLGNPHIISTLGSATNYAFNYSAWHHMYDLTLKNGLWVAHDLGNVNGAPYTAGVSPNFATHWQAPQAARSADGTKVFFTWTDNSTYSLGQANSTPDLYGKAFDVNTSMWTQTKNFTSCNAGLAGKMFYPHMAVEVLEPTASSWKVAGVYGEPSVINDLGVVANFYFLNNLTYSSSEFSVAVPAATVSIAQAPTLLYCPNSTVNINVPGAGDVLWSNSATVNPLPITTGSITSYSVVAQVGCRIGSANISVVNLSVTAGAVTPSVCPGTSASFTAAGNALSYSWSPGTSTGTSVSLIPNGNTVTLTAGGSAGCIYQSTVGIFILPLPTVSISGSSVTCAGSVYTLAANGAQSYIWSNGSTGSVFTGSAGLNIVIVCIGTSANTCTNLASLSIVVNATPNVIASSSQPSICAGQTVALFGSGTAQTYSWNSASTGPNIILSPSATAIYTLTGQNTFSCQTTKTLNVAVYALPTLSVTASRTFVCKGEKVVLSASGASSYTWVTQGAISPTVQVTPTSAQTFTYVVNLMTAEGCTASGNYLMVVSACTGLEAGTEMKEFMIYPNPNSGSFIIQSDNEETIFIFNETGQLINKIEVRADKNYTYEVSNLSPGIYFISGKQHKSKILVNN